MFKCIHQVILRSLGSYLFNNSKTDLLVNKTYLERIWHSYENYLNLKVNKEQILSEIPETCNIYKFVQREQESWNDNIYGVIPIAQKCYLWSFIKCRKVVCLCSVGNYET